MDVQSLTPPRQTTQWYPLTPTESEPQIASLVDRFIPDRTPPKNDTPLFASATLELSARSSAPEVDEKMFAMSSLSDYSLEITPTRWENSNATTPNNNFSEPYHSRVARSLFPQSVDNALIGSPVSRKMQLGEAHRFASSHGAVYFDNQRRNFRTDSFRIIPQTPERILDAPDLLDDYYLNLLDWSSTNILSVALSNTVYLWNASNGTISQLVSMPERENIISSVAWKSDGSTVAVSSVHNNTNLWDAETRKVIQTIRSHRSRVATIAWNGDLIATGSRDKSIHLHDTRESQQRNNRMMLQGHSQEVCGLRWSSFSPFLASGGNDNVLNIWDLRRLGSESSEASILWSLRSHKAAVKALAWNPTIPNLLVSGGGTADKTLRFWDVATGQCTRIVDTKSQVCGVLWNMDGNELISSHGYSSHQLALWKYPTMKIVTELTGHTSRVLHLALAPDGETVVSAAGDETIRFWRCFCQGKGSMHRRAPTSNADCSNQKAAYSDDTPLR